MKIVTHSDRALTNRERLDAWPYGLYRQRRDAETARDLSRFHADPINPPPVPGRHRLCSGSSP